MTENNEKATIELGVTNVIPVSDEVALVLMDDNTVRWYPITAAADAEDNDA